MKFVSYIFIKNETCKAGLLRLPRMALSGNRCLLFALKMQNRPAPDRDVQERRERSCYKFLTLRREPLKAASCFVSGANCGIIARHRRPEAK